MGAPVSCLGALEISLLFYCSFYLGTLSCPFKIALNGCPSNILILRHASGGEGVVLSGKVDTGMQVFVLGDWGSPPSGENFANPPSGTCPRFWTKACPPPAKVCPRKFEKFKYIFVSNLTTFKLKSTLESCISCFK